MTNIRHHLILTRFWAFFSYQRVSGDDTYSHGASTSFRRPKRQSKWIAEFNTLALTGPVVNGQRTPDDEHYRKLMVQTTVRCFRLCSSRFAIWVAQR
jgi:hypothetical protein